MPPTTITRAASRGRHHRTYRGFRARARLDSVHGHALGDYVMVLNDGTKVHTSRVYRESVQALMGDPR